MSEEPSAQAASRAIAHAAHVAVPPRSPRQLHRGHGVDLAPRNNDEYDGMKDPQDHLDQFLAKADLLDISDAAYYSFEQLSQRFLHHFAINKRDPKTASYLFTVTQREHESLREYVQRFSEAVLEVPHVNQELLASIMQQNLRMGRFHESIARKPPATLDELLVRAEKYIQIEETSRVKAAIPSKRIIEEEDHSRRHVSENNQKDQRHVPPPNITRYTLLNAPHAEFLAVAEQ
ncbi:UNVERIFIED_CONTAM: hypothetical protein Scaly_2432000 [Sesamum calycinum]|uniref:Retrotransposon gag domain-containing protein n=1 Tax=Sesamum calycinum TaxID=2727403 RepID=A0AAW2LZI7_9LAMI